MLQEFLLRDIPTSEVSQVEQDFIDDGCTVEKIDQGGGLWTIKAICPED